METRYLKLIEAVVEHGSIRAAADTVGYTQSALTKIVRRVELEFGAEIFERLPRGTRLTACGEVFLSHGRAIQRELRDAAAKIEALASGHAGAVFLGAGPSWLNGFLPVALAEVMRVRPDLEFHVLSGERDKLYEDLGAGILDLILVSIVDGTLDGIVSEPLIPSDLKLTVRQGHRLASYKNLTINDVSEFGWILAEGDRGLESFLREAFKRKKVSWPKPRVEITSRAAMLEILRRTDLVSFLPDTRYYLSANNLVSLDCSDLNWHLPSGLIYREDRPLGIAATFLIEVLRKTCDLSVEQHALPPPGFVSS